MFKILLRVRRLKMIKGTMFAISLLILLSFIILAAPAESAPSGEPRQFRELSLVIPENWSVRDDGRSVAFIGPQRKGGATVVVLNLRGKTQESDEALARQMADGLMASFGGNQPRPLARNVLLVEIPAPAIPDSMKAGLQVTDQDLEARMIVSAKDQVLIMLTLLGRDKETSEVARTIKGSPEVQGAVDQLLAVDFDRRSGQLLK